MHDYLTKTVGSSQCPSSRRRLTWPAVACAALAFSLSFAMTGKQATATVLTTGNVYPSDNPFTTLNFEGLPIDGNVINPFDPPDEQVTLEGILDIMVPANPDDDTNVNLDVIVGQTSFGGVLIDGGSILRFQNLIIGDAGTVGVDPQPRTGTGNVRITGFGSTYNNDPAIMPTIAPLPPPAPSVTVASEVPRPVGVGYDLCVGCAGNGTLEVSFGGRAEIEDGVIVGDTGVGTVLVTGADAFLGSGNFIGGGILDNHATIVGRLGVGLMNITEGGNVFSNRIIDAAAGNNIILAAVIGGDRFNLSGDRPITGPEDGGQGTVNVDGFGSKWIVGGTLQVGGFHNAPETPGGGMDDIEGDSAFYGPAVGRGTLTVSNQGLVSVIPPTADNGPPELDSLQLVIGRFGRVNLAGGHIDLLGGFESGVPGQDPELLDTPVAVVNDGVISGSGTMRTGQFRNRVLGEVRVGAGEYLRIDAAGPLLQPPDNIQPLQNFGLIRVVGTETARASIEFDRSLASQPGGMDPQPALPFLNQRLPFTPPGPPPAQAPNGGRVDGLIHGQWATMQFRSNLLNQGVLAFTAGDNIVGGTVRNRGGFINLAGNIVGRGVTFASGPDTTVVFEDDLINQPGAGGQPPGVTIIEEGADIDVLAPFTFITAGELSIGLIPDNPSTLSVAGNAGISGKLTIRLNGFTSGSLQAGAVFPLISAGGILGGVQFVNPLDPLDPSIDLTKLPLFTEVDIDPIFNSLVATPDLRLIPEYGVSSIVLAVRSIMNIVGPDFTGDNFVDGADLDIWRRFYGITMGATPLQGDADGDGDVDLVDFHIWTQQQGGAPMGFGSGSQLPGSQSGTVPEPASMVLLIPGGMLALALGRRRRRI